MSKIVHRYSPSRDSWYASHLQYPDLPDDLVDATDEQWQRRLNNPDCNVTVVGDKLHITVPAGPSLDDLKRAKINQLRTAFQELKTRPVSFTTAAKEVVQLPNTAEDKAHVATIITHGAKEWVAGAWLDVSGNVVAPFTFTDVKKLHDKMHVMPSYHRLMVLVKRVSEAKTREAVEAFTIDDI